VTDLIDCAQQAEQERLARLLAGRPAPPAPRAKPADGAPLCCEQCADPIAPARLRVHPGARLCIECQQRAERQAAIFAGHR